MNILYRLTAFWYTRTALFLLLVVAAVIGTSQLFPYMGPEALYGIILVVSLALEQMRKSGSYVLLGFPAQWMLRQTGYGLAIALAMIVLIGVVAVVFGAQWQPGGTAIALGVVLSDVLVLAVLAGGEEIVFRGVAFQALYERFGAALTVVLTSLLFAVAHLANPSITFVAVLNIFLAGVLFSLMYTNTRALWMPWAFHFGWNAAQHILLGSPVSGYSMGTPLFELIAPDSELYRIFIADDFGIEGGLLASVLLLAGIGAVSLPQVAQPAPELAARLFRRQYAESMVRHTLRVPWGRPATGSPVERSVTNRCPEE